MVGGAILTVGRTDRMQTAQEKIKRVNDILSAEKTQ